jgi:[CysO sulfur-carrier protein]-S-L-cysteine hydrolase
MSARPVLEIHIPPEIVARVMEHARAELPDEACGLLSGSLRGGRATRFHPARNADASPRRFTLHPEDQVRITFAIERAGEDLVAIFHSHPRSAPAPSPTDRRRETYPGTLHLLASLADADADPEGCLRAWSIRRGTAHEVPIVVGQPASTP